MTSLRTLPILALMAGLGGCRGRAKAGPEEQVVSPPVAGTPVAAEQLVGHWISSDAASNKADSDFVFRSDGSYRMTVSGLDEGKQVKTEASGGYRLGLKNKIVLIPHSVVNSSPDPGKQAELDAENARLTEVLAKPPEIKAKISWTAKGALELRMNDTVGTSTPIFNLRRKE